MLSPGGGSDMGGIQSSMSEAATLAPFYAVKYGYLVISTAIGTGVLVIKGLSVGA